MIAAFLKKTAFLDLEVPLFQFIKAYYGRHKAEELSLKLKEISHLRKECMIDDRVANPSVDIPKYEQYYRLLGVLERRFPFGKNQTGWFGKVQTIMIDFRWADAYIPKKVSSNHSIKLEKLAILYNLAALLSLQAVKRQSSNSEEGLKDAVGLFRDAAGAFKHLASQEEAVGLACTLDIQKDSANMLSAFMLAQAQACFFEMASKKKASPGLLAKLAMGAAQLFEKTYYMLTVNEGLRHWVAKGLYSYEDHIHFQVKYYKAVAEYWLSQMILKSGEEGCYGKEIARLTIAARYLAAAGHLSKKVIPALEEARKHLAEGVVGPRLEQATKDNQVVYFEVVPSLEDLKPTEGTQNVKLNPFSLSSTIEDPFKGLISKTIQRKAEQIRSGLRLEAKRVTEIANQNTDSARAILESLGLPASLESIQNKEGLPDSVWNRIAEIQSDGGVQELESLYSRIEAANAEAWKIHEEISNKLDKEEQVYKEIKQKLGPRWQVTDSAQLTTKYRSDLKVILEFLGQAVKSNTKLQKQITEDSELYRELEKSQEQLNSELPKCDKHDESPCAEKLKKLLDDLSACITERDELKKEYTTQTESIDIASLLMAKESGNVDEKDANKDGDFDLKATTTKIFQGIEEKLNKTYATQKELLDRIVEANEEFVKEKGSNQAQTQRENFIHKLNQAAERFNRCKMHLKDGLKFYTDLMADYITTLRSAVDDYVLARESERDLTLADLKTNVAKLGINVYGNLTSSDSQPSSGSFLSESISQPQSQSQSQSQPQSQMQPSYNPPNTFDAMQPQWGGYHQPHQLHQPPQWPQPLPQHQQYYGGMPQMPQQFPYGGNNIFPQYFGQHPPPQQQPQQQMPPQQQSSHINPYEPAPYYGQQPSNPFYGHNPK